MQLKVRVRRDDVTGVRRVRRKDIAHHPVDRLRPLDVQHPLAIGRIANGNRTVRRYEIGDVALD